MGNSHSRREKLKNESKKMDDMKLELCKCNGAGPIKYTRDFPPAHFTLKVQSFSSLSNVWEEKFESGGYNWRLSIYPTGDMARNGAGYISLYLSISDTSTLPLTGEILVNYKLFVFDQLRDKYLTVHDNPAGIRRFSNISKEWGFAQLISLNTFNKASNGYLVSDSCVFGAEVFVIEYSSKLDCLSMVQEPATRRYTWKISSFSSLHGKLLCSDVFKVGNLSWRLELYPNGSLSGKNTHLSIYLRFLDLKSLPPEGTFISRFAVRVRDQVNGHHHSLTCKKPFDSALQSSWGFPEFLALNVLNKAENGYLTKDNTLIVDIDFLARPQLEISS